MESIMFHYIIRYQQVTRMGTKDAGSSSSSITAHTRHGDVETARRAALQALSYREDVPEEHIELYRTDVLDHPTRQWPLDVYVV